MLSESQWDRYSALLKRLKGLPADQREDVLRSMRAQPEEDPSVLHYVSVYFRLPPEPDRCRTGERIGHFTLGAQLGSGGMGVVYHAKADPPSERDVALKLIHPKLILTGQSDAVERFQDEIKHLAKFELEGIARIYTADTHTEPKTGETIPFFTMQLVRGGVPITAYAKEHTLTVPERLWLFLRVCEAIRAAHQQLVIHRDLKPTNILVDHAGRPCVIDFGLAQIWDSSRRYGGEFIAGTPPYMSPEQVSDAFGPVEPRSDVYTLGFILYELLAGRRPIEVPPNTSWEALHQAILTTIPAPLGQYNAECRGALETIVAKTLAKDPIERYPSVADLHREIDDYLAWVKRVALERAVRLTMAPDGGLAHASYATYPQESPTGSELDKARQFFLGRRLFISTNYDDDFYRLLPLLIMLKADVESSSSVTLPNICIYAPFPKKIQHILGPALTPEDWHAVLKRKWVHVICRKHYFEESWRRQGHAAIKEPVLEYDRVTRLPRHHTVLPDDYFIDTAARAEKLLADTIESSGIEQIHDFAGVLRELDEVGATATGFYRGPFAEIRDRTATEEGYDGYRAALMLFQYFLNDFKQAKDLAYSDLLLPPVYIDMARHLLGGKPIAVATEPLPTRIWADTQLEDYLVDQQEKLKHASFLTDAIEALGRISEKSESTRLLPSARLEDKVEYFAQYHRDAVWLLIWTLAKVSRFSLSGLTLNPVTYQWREDCLYQNLSTIFRNRKRSKRALALAYFLKSVPGADKLGLLELVSRLGGKVEISRLSPGRSLRKVLETTGTYINETESSVNERANNIWSDIVGRLSGNELDLIVGSSDAWANFFVGMEELRIVASQGTKYKEILWRAAARKA